MQAIVLAWPLPWHRRRDTSRLRPRPTPPDAVHEFPFAPEDHERRIEGREAIAARLRQVFDLDQRRLRFGSFDNVRVRETGDEVIIEGDGHHRRAADDTPVEISCAWFITRRDGYVTHFRDYMNPLPLATHQLW